MRELRVVPASVPAAVPPVDLAAAWLGPGPAAGLPGHLAEPRAPRSGRGGGAEQMRLQNNLGVGRRTAGER